jgi:hypothetical protein
MKLVEYEEISLRFHCVENLDRVKKSFVCWDKTFNAKSPSLLGNSVRGTVD